jgi:hypothetical protein
VSFRIFRRSCCRGAGLAFGLREISLLHENSGEIQPGCYKVRPEPQGSFEMADRSLQFSLLGEDPPQSGLRLSVSRGTPNRRLEIGARGSEVTLSERVLPALIGKMSR